MPEYVRVRLPNGVQKSLPADHPAVTAEDVEILDKPALDPVTGAIRPDKVPALPAATGDGYESMTVPALKDEIDKRNTGREPEQQIAATGNKPDLIAALQADDAN